ncbi:hypothetical protein [Flexivirga sp. B27]
MSDDIAASPADAAPEHSLVEIAPGFGALLGPSVPDGFELLEAAVVPDRAKHDITSTVSTLIGAGNLGAQALMGQTNLQGIVRLAPETLKALQTATPLTSGGVNLGTLVDSSGHFAHSVRWMPAAGVQGASAAATIGPALATLAIQIQLAEMKSLMQDNLQLTEAVLKEARNERWSSASALRETLAHALGEAQDIGEVTDGVWQNIAGLEDDLRRERKRAQRAVDDQVRALRAQKGHTDRRKFLDEHGEAILADVLSLVATQQAWFIYQGLRAGHLYEGAETTPANDALISRIVDNAQVEWEKSSGKVKELVSTLHQQFAVFAEFPGSRTMPVGRAHSARKKVSGSARDFLTRLEVLEKEIDYAPRTVPEARVSLIVDEDHRKRVAESLRWQLTGSEELLALAVGDARGAFSGDRYLAVTGERLLVGRASDIDRNGEPWHIMRTRDVRYVKSSANEKWSEITLDVYLPDDELHLKFDVPTDSGTARSDMEQLIQLLRSFMNLPAAEVPTSPLALEAAENDRTPVEPARSPELLDS